jgi:YD repeat-containing protein
MTYLDNGQAERTSAGSSAYLNSSLGVGSETVGGVTTSYTRTPSGHLVSQRTPTGTYYYLFDGLGSVVGMVDTSGNEVASYRYDPYGQTVVKTGTAADERQ